MNRKLLNFYLQTCYQERVASPKLLSFPTVVQFTYRMPFCFLFSKNLYRNA